MALVVTLGVASVVFTGRAEGDLGSLAERGPGGPSLPMQARRRALVDRPWTWVRQVHGSRVVVVDEAGARAGEEADGTVTADPTAALAIFTADCAPVAFSSPEGVLGAAHAGWKGLAAGVIEETVRAMRARGATAIDAALGPTIHPSCYAFSSDDLERVVARLGEEARGSTAGGGAALDLPRATRSAIAEAGANLVFDAASCTACVVDDAGVPAWFSHRARGEESRQAMVVWCP